MNNPNNNPDDLTKTVNKGEVELTENIELSDEQLRTVAGGGVAAETFFNNCCNGKHY